VDGSESARVKLASWRCVDRKPGMYVSRGIIEGSHDERRGPLPRESENPTGGERRRDDIQPPFPRSSPFCVRNAPMANDDGREERNSAKRVEKRGSHCDAYDA